MSGLPVAPFDSSRYIGTVCKVQPTSVEINLPRASSAIGSHFAGFAVQAGQVGEFVVIEGDEHAILGRISAVRLPERERLTVEPTAELGDAPNPVGIAQLLTSIDLRTGASLSGIPSHPRIGQHVYSAHPLVVKRAVEADSSGDEGRVHLAVLPHSPDTRVSLAPSAIFGRHCAVLGTTGGGKSWTLARLLEEIVRLGGKAILFDATGEFHTQDHRVQHVYLGGEPWADDDRRVFVSFPYQHLTESDLFVLFRPSQGVQAPKLREALRSLKLAQIAAEIASDGLVRKANQSKSAFEKAMHTNEAALQAHGADYDITKLGRQIQEECVFTTGSSPGTWGNPALNDLSYCTALISRIDAAITSDTMACVFKPQGFQPLPDVLDRFLEDRAVSVLRVSLESLPFEHNTRELVANAIGRLLLRWAREGSFRERPLVAVLDEAHQFLDKTVGDEISSASLDAFGLLAKEGRKYGLTCVFSTQRPRDIPEDVLSQMGMFIVHRLINERDRSVVERACGNLDASAAAFLPTLGQGEAILVGIDTPMPLPVLIRPPDHEPESKGPDYRAHWRSN